jgi:hypothetical protein
MVRRKERRKERKIGARSECGMRNSGKIVSGE